MVDANPILIDANPNPRVGIPNLVDQDPNPSAAISILIDADPNPRVGIPNLVDQDPNPSAAISVLKGVFSKTVGQVWGPKPHRTRMSSAVRRPIIPGGQGKPAPAGLRS